LLICGDRSDDNEGKADNEGEKREGEKYIKWIKKGKSKLFFPLSLMAHTLVAI
jgi:hypothetical protein